MVKLIALETHTVDGSRRLNPGDRYTISSEIVAKILISKKLAKLDVPEPKTKREYQRRDMKAQD